MNEPHEDAEPGGAVDAVPELSRARLVAGTVLLVGLAFVQSPGFLIADTKFDLAQDPGGFLARAVHLWDPQSAFGQLQNQAYGYWWPMGPFFWVGDLLGLDGWVVQRLWIGLVLSVAFVGAALLARALGVRSELACLVAGAAYATSPRLVSILGGISIEAWPSALAPWVLLPLVWGSRRGSTIRAAGWAAVAVGMVGGVNAAASAAVLPLGALWLLTRERGPRRRSLLVWWPVLTFLATAWWLVPLFILGSYSPPFLDWIESASVTTFPTTPFDVLRGTSAWIPYVEPRWVAGNDLLRLFPLILNSAVLLVLGAWGIVGRRAPERAFLALGVSVGLVLVSFGHLGATQGWLAGLEQPLLDGVLAPLRNVHKFDPVVRLPLVIGVGLWLDGLLRRRRPEPVRRSDPVRRGLLPDPVRASGVMVVVLAVLATASPLVFGRLAPADPVREIPGYWVETADWLAAGPAEGTALLVPGSGFGTYLWGSPRDEPMQWLAGSPWAVRNAVPLSPAGNIRMLDAIETRLAQGRGSAGLADFARRAGISHLVVRNDLAPGSDVPHPVLVHQALESSPGISRVRSFGPLVGGPPLTTVGGRRVVVEGGWQQARPAVEVYQVGGTGSAVATTTEPVTVVGGPEDLLDLADLGLISEAPTLLGVDTEEVPRGPVVLTDGLQARERNFGRVHDAVSQVRAPDDRRSTGNPVRDYLLGPDRWSTQVDAVGGSVSATSSLADPTSPAGGAPGFSAWAAVDGDPATSFRSRPGDRGPEWRLEVPDPVDPVAVDLTAADDAPEQTLAVEVDGERVEVVTLDGGATVSVPVPEIVASLAVRSVGEQEVTTLDLAEVEVPGVDTERWLRLPALPVGWPAPEAIVLRALVEPRTGCTSVAGEVRCSPEQPAPPSEEPGALRRVVDLPVARDYPIRVWVRPDPDQASLLAQRGQLARVEASSQGYPDGQASAAAAVDGDGSTTWYADVGEEEPRLRVSLLRERRVRAVEVLLDPTSPARAAREVLLSWPGGVEQLELDREGRARLSRPVVASSFELRVVGADDAVGLARDASAVELPIGVTELRLRGVPELPLALGEAPIRFGCGSGPRLSVGDRTVATRVEASAQAVLRGDPIEAIPCSEARVRLGEGQNRLELSGGREFLPSLALLGGAVTESPVALATAESDGAVERRFVGVPTGSTVALSENANAGWRSAGAEPVVVDGWRQGWRAGTSDFTVRFVPDRAYRAGLLGGALLGVALLLVPLLAARRRDHGSRALVGPGRPRPVAAWVGGLVVAGLVVGWPGAAGFAAFSLLALRLPAILPWLVATLLGLSSAAYLARPWGSSSGWAGTWAWPGWLVAVAVALVLWGAARSAWEPPTRRSRWAGSSTSR